MHPFALINTCHDFRNVHTRLHETRFVKGVFCKKNEYELHELTANSFLPKLFFTLSDEQKEVLYYLFVKQYSTTRLAAIRGQSDRNIRKLRMTIQKKLQKRLYAHLSEKLENDHGLTLREREFMEEYKSLLQTMGKDTVIRRENKTKPRKKKAALEDAKDG